MLHFSDIIIQQILQNIVKVEIFALHLFLRTKRQTRKKNQEYTHS